MKIKIRIAVLCLLLTAALYMGAQAVGSVRNSRTASVPEEVYRELICNADKAKYYVKSRDGYVAVFENKHFREPLKITEIETGQLRKADRAMLEKGIPVADRMQLLRLLEDLGS